MRERDLVPLLNGLVEACCDGSDGLETAAQSVVDLRLKRLLRRLALERRGFAEELRQEVLRLGGEPRVCGTVRGALHRGWIRMTGAGGAASTPDVLRQCAFGEGTTLERYETVPDGLPADLEALLARHARCVAEGRDLLAELTRALR